MGLEDGWEEKVWEGLPLKLPLTLLLTLPVRVGVRVGVREALKHPVVLKLGEVVLERQ